MNAVSDPRKIKRVILNSEILPENELRNDVMNRAKTNFGYGSNKFVNQGELHKLLAKLEIDPLDTIQVKLYKASKEFKGMLSGTKKYWTVLPILWSLFAAFVLAEIHHDSGFFILPIVLLGILSVTFTVGGAVEMHGYGERIIRKWENSDLKYYGEYVPVHVLNTANRIYEANPHVSFQVESLVEQTEKVNKPLPDPFLRVQLGNEYFYVEVWDEREFEAKM